MIDDDDQTPAQPLRRPLEVHRRYIEVLGAAIPRLNSLTNTFAEILREIRLARRPIGQRTLTLIADGGAALEETGRLIKVGFQR